MIEAKDKATGSPRLCIDRVVQYTNVINLEHNYFQVARKSLIHLSTFRISIQHTHNPPFFGREKFSTSD